MDKNLFDPVKLSEIDFSRDISIWADRVLMPDTKMKDVNLIITERFKDGSVKQTIKRGVIMSSPIMKYFAYAHLPQNLQHVSRSIGDIARKFDAELPDGPEKSAGLRKLLEAKDCFVRANL